MMSLAFAYFPLVLLIFLMVKTNSMASDRALPLCAFLAYLIVVFVYQFNVTVVHANVIRGALLALTPLSIVAGAIFLFKCMEDTGALDKLKTGLNTVSTHPVAQIMIIGWAFAFLIEGASGFGTPAAIAAPILFALGFPAIRVAIVCLILNTVPVTFGALGTPIWFGLMPLSLPHSTLLSVAQQAALINTLVAPVIVFAALRIVIDDKSLLYRSVGFILIAVFACTLPHLALSYVDIEFPSLVGGAIGLVITTLAAKFRLGLSDHAGKETQTQQAPQPISGLLRAAFPLYGTVLVLLATRLPDLGLKAWLQATTPSLSLELGSLGTLHISQSLVIRLTDILSTNETWSHSLLYIPSLIPFVLVGVISVYLCRFDNRLVSISSIFSHTLHKIKTPYFALTGALIFVNMMMLGGDNAAVAIIGQHLAQISGQYWIYVAPLLGALGSFFSGSATISNLTFAAVQLSIAEQLALPQITVLALQSVGAAMGNMVCINNIVAVTAILGLTNAEGQILKKTVVILSIYALLTGFCSLLLV